MKKIIELILFITVITCLSSCDLLFGAKHYPVKKYCFEDIVEPSCESMDESENVKLYKMSNQEYLDYMSNIYEYFISRTEYIGTEGRDLSSQLSRSSTYEFVKSSSLSDHYNEETNSYSFIAALDLDSATNDLYNDISVNFTYDENNEYSLKRIISRNSISCTYHVLTFLESLQFISTKIELANALANYISYESDFSKNLYKDYFKYECVYSKYIVNASYDVDHPLTYSFNGLPCSITFVKGKDYNYSLNQSVFYGYYIGEQSYYYIERQKNSSYSDLKNLVRYSSVSHHQNQFIEYEDDMEEVLTYESNVKTIYSSLDKFKEDSSSDYGLENYVSSILSGFNDSYINLLLYDCTEDKETTIYYSGNEVKFIIEETVEYEMEKHIVYIEGSLNTLTCELKYKLDDLFYINNKLITDSSCNVSLTFIDENYKVEYDDTLEYEVVNYGE